MNFDDAFTRLLGHEGGFVDHPRDPGGATNWGISQRSYPGEDIRNLTQARAKEIYRRDFWGPAGCDAAPEALRFALFDFAVNSGVSRAVRTLQEVVGETPDGKLGPRTLQAMQSMPAHRLAARFYGARLEFMAGLPTWASFGKGWARRVAAELRAL
jgi:lysozyme family protein